MPGIVRVISWFRRRSWRRPRRRPPRPVQGDPLHGHAPGMRPRFQKGLPASAASRFLGRPRRSSLHQIGEGPPGSEVRLPFSRASLFPVTGLYFLRGGVAFPPEPGRGPMEPATKRPCPPPRAGQARSPIHVTGPVFHSKGRTARPVCAEGVGLDNFSARGHIVGCCPLQSGLVRLSPRNKTLRPCPRGAWFDGRSTRYVRAVIPEYSCR